MQSIEINIYGKEFWVKFVIYKNYTEMQGQQTKFSSARFNNSLKLYITVYTRTAGDMPREV